MQPLIEDLKTLNQIGETLNKASDARGALESTLAHLVELMGLKTGWIFNVVALGGDPTGGHGSVHRRRHSVGGQTICWNYGAV